MENCYFSMFKGDTNNNSLPYAGYEQYRVSLVNQSVGMFVRFNKAETVILLDGTWTANGSREIEAPADTSFYPGTTTITPDNVGQQYCTILLPKYSCYYYGNVCPLEGQNTVDLTGFKYGSATDATEVRIFVTTGIVKGLGYVPFEKVSDYFKAGDNWVDENIDLTNLGKNGLLTGFNMAGIGVDGNVSGSLDNLGKSNITWENSSYLPNTKNVSIDLVNFVNNRRIAGATSGTITFRFLGTITVKANGVVLDVPAQSNDVLVWDASSITLNGNPIS